MIEQSEEEEWYGMCEINKSEQSNGIQIYTCIYTVFQ